MNVIEFLDDSGEIMVTRIPPDGTSDFKTGSQLIVQESQTAVFFRDGKAYDGFGPGRHTLTTQNLPLLAKLFGNLFGKSPFRSYVYYVATKTFTNLGWGTQSPVFFRDADLRMVSLRAHGSFAIRITKPRTFLDTLVGTRGIETTFALHDYLRSIIISRLTESMGKHMTSILDLPVEYGNIASYTKQACADDFGQYGIQLVDMLVEAITPPPEVMAKMNEATGLAAQDAEKYKAIAAADALRAAASNPAMASNGMTTGMGMGMGLGMAREMAAMFGAGMAPPVAGQPVAAASTGPAKLAPEQLKAKLTQLKSLADDGLITAEDFAEQKRRLLDLI